MIDLHTHVAPGVDDGVRSIDEAMELLRLSWDDGIRTVVATPHVRGDFPTSAAVMAAAVERLSIAATEARLGIEVRPGAEIALERLDGSDGLPALWAPLAAEAGEHGGRADEIGAADDLLAFGLGGEQVVLLEAPYVGWPTDLPRTVARLVRDRWTVVLAHPERNELVAERAELLQDVVAAGALVQLTAASVDGRLGRDAARRARRLLDLGLAHVIASDAHDARRGLRGPGLSKARDVVGGPLGRWLVESAPAAILAGDALPPRPPGRVRRRWWR